MAAEKSNLVSKVVLTIGNNMTFLSPLAASFTLVVLAAFVRAMARGE